MRLATLVCVATIACASPARANDLHGYYDFIIPDIVGELGVKTYDVDLHRPDNRDVHLGTATLDGGRYAGGGFGVRVLAAWPRWLLVGAEIQLSGGRITGAATSWRDLSNAVHYTMVGLVGAHLSLEYVMLHVAGVVGLDSMQLDARGDRAGAGGATGVTGVPVAAPPPASNVPIDVHLWRVDLRAGVQAGVHVNIARFVALFADGTIDYDGQYRIRCGIAVGAARNERW